MEVRRMHRPFVLEIAKTQSIRRGEDQFVEPNSLEEYASRRQALVEELKTVDAQIFAGRPSGTARPAYRALRQSLAQRKLDIAVQLEQLKNWARDTHSERIIGTMEAMKVLLDIIDRAEQQHGLVLTDDESEAVVAATVKIEEHHAYAQDRKARKTQTTGPASGADQASP